MSAIIKTPTTELQKKDAEQSALYSKKFQQLQQNIDTETSRRIASDTALASNISALIETLANEVKNRTDAITAEKNERIASDTAILNSLNAEIQNRKDADTEINGVISLLSGQLQNAVDKESADVSQLAATISDLTATHSNDISNFRADFNSSVQTLQNALTDETQNRTQALNELQAALLLSIGNNQAAQDIQNENLRNQIQSATATQNASVQDLADKLNKEIQTRAEEDSNFATTISNEINNRKNAVTNLQGTLTAQINSTATDTLNNAKSYTDQKFNGVASSLNDFTAPTASTAGKAGLVPAPPKGTDLKVLTNLGWRAMDSAELTISTVPSQAGTLTYNKNSQSPTWANFDTSKLSISGTTSGTSAGTYTVYFTPTGLYVWADTKTQEAKAVTWTIQKLKLAKPYASVTEFANNGTTHTLQVYNYDSNYITQSGTTSASAVGSYSAGYTLKNSSNTTWADGTTAKVTINWQITNATLTQEQSSGFAQVGTLTYSGSNQSPTIQRYNSSVHELSGDTSKSAAGTYTIYIAPKSGLTWYNGTTTPIAVTWTIQKKSLAKPVAAATSFQHDGNSKTLSVTNYNSTYMTRTGTVTATDAGEYSATYALKNTSNTQWEDGTTENVVISWVINSNKLKKPILYQGSVVYDGTEHTARMSYFDSATMTATGTFSATNAGNYTITVALKDKTVYQWEDGTTGDVVLTWAVAKKTIWSPSIKPVTYEYTGANITALLQGVSSQEQWIKVSGETSAKNVGDHTITFSLTNKENTYWVDGLMKGTSNDLIWTWTITPKTLTEAQSNLVQDTEIIYDGKSHGWTNAVSIFQSLLYAYYSGDSPRTAAGTYTTYVKPGSNYCWYDGTTDPKAVTWTISPRKFAKPYLATAANFTYDGTAKTVSFNNFDSNYMKVTGTSSTNAGDFTATISLKNTSNTHWEDDTTAALDFSWKIEKAVIDVPTAESTYFVQNGQTQSLTVSGYDSSKMTQGGTLSASATGTYSATYTLKDTTNYIFSDGSTKVTIAWEIGGVEVPVPTYESLSVEPFMMGKFIKWYTPAINFNNDLMTATASSISGANLNVGSFVSLSISTGTSMNESNWGTSNHAYTVAVKFNLKDKTNYKWADGTTGEKTVNVVLKPFKVSLPVQDVPLTYNGTAQYWHNSVLYLGEGGTSYSYWGAGLLFRGIADSSAKFTDAGTHTVALNLMRWCIWDDGTIAAKNFSFTIDRGKSAITATFSNGESINVEDSGIYTTPFHITYQNIIAHINFGDSHSTTDSQGNHTVTVQFDFQTDGPVNVYFRSSYIVGDYQAGTYNQYYNFSYDSATRIATVTRLNTCPDDAPFAQLQVWFSQGINYNSCQYVINLFGPAAQMLTTFTGIKNNLRNVAANNDITEIKAAIVDIYDALDDIYKNGVVSFKDR